MALYRNNILLNLTGTVEARKLLNYNARAATLTRPGVTKSLISLYKAAAT